MKHRLGASTPSDLGLETQNLGIVALACLVLGATAAGVSYLPARRAARLPPLTALRDD